MWTMWNPSRAGKGALKWQESNKSHKHWLLADIVGEDGGTHELLDDSHSAHVLTLPKALLTPSMSEYFCASAFMVPFLPSANVRLSKPAQKLHQAAPMNRTSLGCVRCCTHAVNFFTVGSAAAPGKRSQQVHF